MALRLMPQHFALLMHRGKQRHSANYECHGVAYSKNIMRSSAMTLNMECYDILHTCFPFILNSILQDW